jgi:prephenate dehydratase
MLKIGIQGIRASFHDVAAHKFFSGSEIQLIECRSFKALCGELAAGRADHCMMAIENSIAGSILTNYTLLENHGFKIVGETYLRIEMCLLALPGQKLSDIRIVQSHPMAILQCDDFLATLPDAQVLEFVDTAESAREIANRKLKHHAAIASHVAAETYGLEILKRGIETNQQNYTRFLTIRRSEDYAPSKEANKASIRFEAPNRPGSLADILDVFKQCRVNMTKIQSVPILSRPYQYGFHIDLEWEAASEYSRAMREIKPKVTDLIDFGDYPRGERPGS